MQLDNKQLTIQDPKSNSHSLKWILASSQRTMEFHDIASRIFLFDTYLSQIDIDHNCTVQNVISSRLIHCISIISPKPLHNIPKYLVEQLIQHQWFHEITMILYQLFLVLIIKNPCWRIHNQSLNEMMKALNYMISSHTNLRMLF